MMMKLNPSEIIEIFFDDPEKYFDHLKKQQD
jgi:hypothetical protein